MNNVELENSLIVVNMSDVMLDYVALQPDIDETKVKAAAIMAQTVDIKRLIGAANIQRCVDPQTEEDNALKSIIIAPLCYYTYSRLLRNFHSSYTESGYTIEELAASRNEAKSVANEMVAVAEVGMQEVVEFLELENQNDENVKPENMTPTIRIFGGQENRASN